MREHGPGGHRGICGWVVSNARSGEGRNGCRSECWAVAESERICFVVHCAAAAGRTRAGAERRGGSSRRAMTAAGQLLPRRVSRDRRRNAAASQPVRGFASASFSLPRCLRGRRTVSCVPRPPLSVCSPIYLLSHSIAPVQSLRLGAPPARPPRPRPIRSHGPRRPRGGRVCFCAVRTDIAPRRRAGTGGRMGTGCMRHGRAQRAAARTPHARRKGARGASLPSSDGSVASRCGRAGERSCGRAGVWSCGRELGLDAPCAGRPSMG